MALKERKIEMIEWTTVGKNVGGYLLDVVRQKFKDGIGLTYVIRRTDGSVAVFKGSTQLNFALSPSDKGKFIQVGYLGEDTTKELKSGYNRPKMFKVEVDEERTLAPVGELGITDDDIPF